MRIDELIQQSQWTPLLRSSDNIYFAPVIPNKKLQGAMSYLPHGVNPSEVLMLIDDTVFGSAKVGMCLTAKGIFYKASFEDEKAYLFEHIQTIVNIDAEMQIMIDLFAYFITFSAGQWNNRSKEAVSDHFTKLNDKAVHQYVEKLLNVQMRFDYEDLLHRLADMKDKLAYNFRREMIEQLVYAIQPELLNEQTLQAAYRKKMADFHPDKYQSLPESVQQLIEQQAQQLNQARAVLKAYLGV